MKVVILKPEVIDVPDNALIPAGAMSVIPAVPWEDMIHIDDVDEFEREHGNMPDFTVISAGQYLSRELYPELHDQYLSTGGFHQFQLPALERKFLLGFQEDGNPILGDAIVYFQNYPVRLFGDDVN